MDRTDVKSIGVGVLAWAAAVPVVFLAGPVVAKGGTGTKLGMLGVGLGIAVATTPLLSYLLGWNSRSDRVRGIALALGTAQVIDGLIFFFRPDFYSPDKGVALAAAGNIFFGAGALGILSVVT